MRRLWGSTASAPGWWAAAAAGLLFIAQLPYPGLPAPAEALLPVLLVPLGPALFLAALADGRGLGAVLVFGFLWWFLAGHFLLHVGPMLGLASWAATTVIGTAWTALLGLALLRLRDRHGPDALLRYAPAIWTAWEMVRCWSAAGIPWLALGHAFWKLPVMIQIAELTSYYGLTYVLATFAAALARVLRRDPAGRRQFAVAVALALGCALYGVGRLARLDTTQGAPARVALVQANTPTAEKDDPAAVIPTFTRLLRLTTQAQGADLVVWSETAVPADIMNLPGASEALAAVARKLGATLLVGAIERLPEDGRLGRRANAAFLIGPDGRLWDTYRKVHLVLFGEYLPGRDLPLLRPLARTLPQFSRGERFRPVHTPLGPLAVAICYEGIFPQDVRRLVRSGAVAIVVITNDDQFGPIGAREHYQQVVFRCVETRRWLVRCANSGISCVIDPAGRVVAASEWDRAEVLSGELRRRTGDTFYLRWGDLFGWLCLVAGLTALLRPREAADRETQPTEEEAHVNHDDRGS